MQLLMFNFCVIGVTSKALSICWAQPQSVWVAIFAFTLKIMNKQKKFNYTETTTKLKSFLRRWRTRWTVYLSAHHKTFDFQNYCYFLIKRAIYTSLRSLSLFSFANEEEASIAFSRKNLHVEIQDMFSFLQKKKF